MRQILQIAKQASLQVVVVNVVVATSSLVHVAGDAVALVP